MAKKESIKSRLASELEGTKEAIREKTPEVLTDQVGKGRKRLLWGLVGFLVGLVLVGLAGFLLTRQRSFSIFEPSGQGEESTVQPRKKLFGFLPFWINSGEEPLVSVGESSVKCQNIDTSNWVSRDLGITIKHPPDWESQNLQEGQGGTGPKVWFHSFGPKGKSPVVWTGGFAMGLDELKKDLVSDFKILGEEKVIVDQKNGTKLLVQAKDKAHKEYFYYLPEFFNVPQTLRGPALESSTDFANCEPEIFQLMVEAIDLDWKMPGFDDFPPSDGEPADETPSEEEPSDDWSGDEPSSTKLLPCPQDLLSSEEELIEKQEDWWEKVGQDECDAQPKDPVCCYIRSIYEGGQESVVGTDYDNLCWCCSFFNKDSYRGFRGTQMYLLGYRKGVCE